MNRSSVYLSMSCALSIFFLTAFASLTLSAQEALDPTAEKFVVELWERGSSNRKKAEAIFEAEGVPTEQALYAYALNQIKQTRFRRARVPADELTQKFPKNLDGWVVKIWLDTLVNDFDRALIGIQLLKRQLDDAPDLEEARRDEIHLRIARLLGYLQGPVSKSTDPMTLNDTLLKFTAGMTPEQLKKFNDESLRMLDQFDQRVQDTADLEAEELAKAQVEHDQKKQNLQNANVQLDQRRQQIAPERERVRQESDQKLSAIDSQMTPLRTDLAGIDSTITSLQLTYQNVVREINLLQQQLAVTDDLAIRNFLFRQLNVAELDATAINNDIFNLRARWRTVAAQLDGLALERNRIARGTSNRLGQLDEESTQINRQQRRNASTLVKLAAGPKVGDKIQGAQIDSVALRNYDPFPIELYRQRFLDQFPNN